MSPTAPPATRPTPAWRVVADRELRAQLHSKPFLVSTAILVGGVILLIALTSLLAGRDHVRTVGVVDAVGTTAVERGSTIAKAIDDNTTLKAKRYAGSAAVEKAVRDGDVDAALVPASDGFDIVGDGSVDATVEQALRTSVTSSVVARNAAQQDVDLAALQKGTNVDQRLLDPDAKDAGVRQTASFVFVILFYITALSFGMAIASGVTQEKESRVVEILAAAIPIRALLWGKIAATTVLAVGQVLLLGAVGVVALLVSGRGSDLAVVAAPMAWYVVFFVLGFVALASLWTAAGSLAGRQQDLQATTAPLQMLLFAPYIIALVAGEGVKTVVSMLPIVATMLMPSRMAEGSVPLWQVGVAIVTTLVAAVLLVRLGATIYERTLLRTTKSSVREALA